MFIYDGTTDVPKDVTAVTIGGSTSLTSSSSTSNNSSNSSKAVTYIKVSAFANCTQLKTIIIPHTVSHIGESAFEGCTSLLSVHFGLPPSSPSSTSTSTSTSSLTYIGEHVFKGCKSLVYINIPTSVTYVGDHIFYSCDALLSIITNYRDVFTLVKNRWNIECYPLHSICSSLYITLGDLEQVISDLTTSSTNRNRNWNGKILDSFNEHENGHEHEEHSGGIRTINNENDNSNNYNSNSSALTRTDPWGFTPLHILCCNPNATSEMIQYLLEHAHTRVKPTKKDDEDEKARVEEDSIGDGDDDDDKVCNAVTMMKISNGMKPIHLYLASRKNIVSRGYGCDYGHIDLPLCLALKLGMKWANIEQMIYIDMESKSENECGRNDTRSSSSTIILNDGAMNSRTSSSSISRYRSSLFVNKSLEQGRRDKTTFFYPFMLAAIHPMCDLESVYRLALYNVDNIEAKKNLISKVTVVR